MPYFRIWKRKLGFITLLMACVFTAGWVRSTLCFDRVIIRTSHDTYVEISSNRGQLVVNRFRESPDIKVFANWQSYPATDRGLYVADNETEIQILGRSKRKILGQWNLFHFRYWSVAIPLALLSAYLLLSKP